MNRLSFVIGTLLLFVTTGFCEWEKIELGSKEAQVLDIHTHKGYQFIAVHKQGVYRRKLEDTTWSMINRDTAFEYGSQFFSYKDLLFWGYNNTLSFVSKDTGIHWEEAIASFSEEVIDITALANRVLLLNDKGLFLHEGTLEDDTWLPVEFAPGGTSLRGLRKIDNVLYATGWGEIFISKDSAQSWTPMSEGLPERVSINDVFQIRPGSLLAATGEGVYKYTDSSKSWSLFHDEFSYIHDKEIKELVGEGELFYGFIRSDLNLYPHKICKFTDWGKTPAMLTLPHNDGFNIKSLGFHNGDLYCGGYNGVYVSTNEGDSWRSLQEGIEGFPMWGNVDFHEEHVAYSIRTYDRRSAYFSRKKSSDAWEQVDGEGKDLYIPYVFGDSVYLSSTDEIQNINDTLYYAAQDIKRSVDGGKTWDVLCSKSPKSSYWHLAKIDSVLVSFFFAPNQTRKTAISHDKGTTYEKYDMYNIFRGIALYNKKRLVTYWDSTKSLFISDNFGETWKEQPPADSTKITYPVRIASDIFFTKGIRKGQPEAWIYSLDGGLNWKQLIAHDAFGITVGDMGISFDSTHLGIYNTRGLTALYKISFDALRKGIPIVTPLLSKHTQQFLQTQISAKELQVDFSLPMGASYELSLYSLSGRRVRSFKGTALTGMERHLFHRSDLAPGPYVLHLKTGIDVRATSVLLP